MSLTVAIVGRPNVGKSTLFNRLTGSQRALVHDQPGVTRDRRAGDAAIGDLTFTVLDTAGLEEAAAADSLESRMMTQTEAAVDAADAVLFMIDGKAGVTPHDEHFAGWLRRKGRPVILLVNKCDSKAGQEGMSEAHGLGFEEVIGVSASHGTGLDGIYEVLLPYRPAEPAHAEVEEGEPEDAEVARPLQLAIVGRPNAGKSTLMNALLGEERVITGPIPGMTRDAITVEWQWNGRPIRLIDTAGMRKKARVTEALERLAVDDARHAVQFAHVVALLIDATEGIERQDLTLASHVADEGRALVVVMNKWDLVENKAQWRDEMRYRLDKSLPQVKGVPLVTISALNKQGLAHVMAAVEQVYDLWNRRVPTGALNQWLEATLTRHPPPLAKNNRRIKCRYITQSNVRPPTFALFCSQPKQLPDSYRRYLVAGLRTAFGLEGVPIRLMVRGGKNPYAKG